MKNENTKITETFLNPLTGIYEEILKKRPEEILEKAFKPHVNIGTIGHPDISRLCALVSAAIENRPYEHIIFKAQETLPPPQPLEHPPIFIVFEKVDTTPTPEDLTLIIKELANSYIKPYSYFFKKQPTIPFYSGIYKENKRDQYKPNKKYTGRKK